MKNKRMMLLFKSVVKKTIQWQSILHVQSKLTVKLSVQKSINTTQNKLY